jgi:tetratricopeptide (TPR) repeat protein
VRTADVDPERRRSSPGGTPVDRDAALREAAEHWRARRLDAAARLCDGVLHGDPADVDALNLRAIIAFHAGETERSLGLIRSAIARRPHDAKLHSNRGLILTGAGRAAEAVQAYRTAIRHDPGSADAHANLGLALVRLGRLEEAEAAERRAVELAPNHPGILCNLGNVLRKRGRPEAAIDVFHAALEKDAGWAPAYCNLGFALWELERHDEGIAAARRAIEINPNLAEAHDCLGVLLRELGALDEALAAHRTAQRLDPHRADAFWHEALIELLRGNLAAGWSGYEWGWRATFGRGRKRHADLPCWDGSPPGGRTLLVWAEQGVGDQIMFSVYLRDLLAAGARCVVEADRRLEPLLTRSFAGIRFLPQGHPPDSRPAVDWQIAMGSLGRWLRPSPACFSQRAAYLRADETARRRLRARYKAWARGKRLVGISWRGGPPDRPAVIRARSIALERWAPILRTPGCAIISLQYGEHSQEIAHAGATLGVPVLRDDAVDPLTSLDDLAAQIAAMDLVISIDNSTVHLAGALGVEVWVLLPAIPDWRWLLDRDDSPWYGSARLFRQSRRGAWEEVIDSVAATLAQRTREPP